MLHACDGGGFALCNADIARLLRRDTFLEHYGELLFAVSDSGPQ